MKYRSYSARIDYDADADVLAGRVLGINEQIEFHGAGVEELRADFEFAVDHYLAECARMGRTPEKPAPGKLLLRLPPDLHAAAVLAASAERVSLNQWLVSRLTLILRDR